MKLLDKRPEELGYLFVVGGPGGSGASTIARALAHKYELHMIDAGQVYRKIAEEEGFDEITDFLASEKFKKNPFKYDRIIDEELLKFSYNPNTLIGSKVFAGLSVVYGIPCTVRIWLTASIEVRVRRTLAKEDKLTLDKPLSKKSKLYRTTADRLLKRYSQDKNRYAKLYGIKYEKPSLYNDIVLDTSNMTEALTLAVLVKKIEAGGFLEMGSKLQN